MGYSDYYSDNYYYSNNNNTTTTNSTNNQNNNNNTSLVFYGYAINKDNETLIHSYKLVVDVVANTVVVPRSLTTIYKETDKNKPTILQIHEEYNRVKFDYRPIKLDSSAEV